jgi:hypothetical protein
VHGNWRRRSSRILEVRGWAERVVGCLLATICGGSFVAPCSLVTVSWRRLVAGGAVVVAGGAIDVGDAGDAGYFRDL